MTRLHRLYEEQGQSPWLDNLTRPYLRDGTLARLVEDGVRGVTANPTIFAIGEGRSINITLIFSPARYEQAIEAYLSGLETLAKRGGDLASEDHGTVARTVDSGVAAAAAVMDHLSAVGIDMDDVGHRLEEQGVASFHDSFAHVLSVLDARARELARG